MKRPVRVVALVVVGFVALALFLDGLAGLIQPALGGPEGVLRTTDEERVVHETRLAVFEDQSGAIWVQSGHHFRGWYGRVKGNPEVEFVREGVLNAYRAVPLETARSYCDPSTKRRTREPARGRSPGQLDGRTAESSAARSEIASS